MKCYMEYETICPREGLVPEQPIFPSHVALEQMEIWVAGSRKMSQVQRVYHLFACTLHWSCLHQDLKLDGVESSEHESC